MTSETTKKRNRLFAKLMVEEYERRCHYPEDTSLAAIDVRTFTYLYFLKAQRSNAPFDPYSMAVKQIQG